MPGPEPATAVPGPCTFGAGRLLPLIDVLSAEIAGYGRPMISSMSTA